MQEQSNISLWPHSSNNFQLTIKTLFTRTLPINQLGSPKFFFFLVESDFITIIFSAVLSLGGVWALVSGFDDDDNDQDGGGTGSPVLTPSYMGSPA